MNKEEIIKEFREKGANLEHDRWARWQAWCHKVLRENCPSPQLEEVLERWDKQIATKYEDLSEKEKESDRKETRNYIPLLVKALSQQKQDLLKKIEFFERDMRIRLHDEPYEIVESGLEDIKNLIKQQYE